MAGSNAGASQLPEVMPVNSSATASDTLARPLSGSNMSFGVVALTPNRTNRRLFATVADAMRAVPGATRYKIATYAGTDILVEGYYWQKLSSGGNTFEAVEGSLALPCSPMPSPRRRRVHKVRRACARARSCWSRPVRGRHLAGRGEGAEGGALHGAPWRSGASRLRERQLHLRPDR